MKYSNAVTICNMSWYIIPNINITTEETVQAIIMLFEYLNIVASSTGCIAINNIEKSVTVNIDKTMNNTKYHS